MSVLSSLRRSPLFKRYDIDRLDNRDPALIARFADLLEVPLARYFQPEVRGLQRIPEGAALYVGNHNAALLSIDSFIFGLAVLRERGDAFLPFGLGHELAISVPIFHQLLMPLGAVRASHANAERLFAQGKKVLVYPGGDLDAMRAYRHRKEIHFGPRRGYIRLALRNRVPIVPVISAGAHETFLVLDDGQWLARLLRVDRLLRVKVFPIALSVPWGLTIGPAPTHLPLPTRVFIETLAPITFSRTGPEAAQDPRYVEACHQQVHSTMEAALSRLYEAREAAGGKVLL